MSLFAFVQIDSICSENERVSENTRPRYLIVQVQNHQVSNNEGEEMGFFSLR